jgi:Rod binding domain-containing protein
MEAVSGIQNSTLLAPEQSHTEKLVRAAHQFEAVLLSQLLGSLERTFSALGEKKTETGSDHYQFLGMQALASSVAEKGGLGIADMIVRNLKRREQNQPTNSPVTP